jgi:hypothetical protein
MRRRRRKEGERAVLGLYGAIFLKGEDGDGSRTRKVDVV